MMEKVSATGEPDAPPPNAPSSHRQNTAYVAYRDAPTGTAQVVGVRRPRPKPPIDR
jgi:hypothetical protein